MMVAVFGSQEHGTPCSRAVGVVPNTLKLIIMDAYVGVYSTSMKKISDSIKSQIIPPQFSWMPKDHQSDMQPASLTG